LERQLQSKKELQLWSRGLHLGAFDETLLEEPRGICLDSSGNSLIVTTKTGVVKLDLEKGESTLLAGGSKFGFRDGSSSLFDHPDGVVALD